MSGLETNNGKSNHTIMMPTVLEGICSSENVSGQKCLIMQHALRDTRSFIEMLVENGIQVTGFLGKPNSMDLEEFKRISDIVENSYHEPNGYKPYDWYEQKGNVAAILNERLSAISKNERLMILDVGGYFCDPVLKLPSAIYRKVAGIVEVTTFGHTRYDDAARQLPVPVMSIAKSPLKGAEGVHVGETVLQATDDILREGGKVLTSTTVGVIGYGMIGSQIAHAAKRRHLDVIVTDRNPIKMVEAHLDGFRVMDMPNLMRSSKVLFSATGSTTITVGDIEEYSRNDQLLVSGGSRAAEFPMLELNRLGQLAHTQSPQISQYALPSGKWINVAANGKAVNFLKDGTPEQVMDLVFAEIYACMEYLWKHSGPTGVVLELSDDERAAIARKWLRKNS